MEAAQLAQGQAREWFAVSYLRSVPVGFTRLLFVFECQRLPNRSDARYVAQAPGRWHGICVTDTIKGGVCDEYQIFSSDYSGSVARGYGRLCRGTDISTA